MVNICVILKLLVGNTTLGVAGAWLGWDEVRLSKLLFHGHKACVANEVIEMRESRTERRHEPPRVRNVICSGPL